MTELIPCGRPRRPRAGVLTEPVSERSGRFERSSDAVISSSQARPLQCSCLRCPVLIEGDTDRRHMTLSVHNVCGYSGPSAAVVPRQCHHEGGAQKTIEAVRQTHPEGSVARAYDPDHL